MTLPAFPPRYRLPAAVAAGVLLVGGAYLAARPAEAPATPEPVATAEAPPPPSGDNVDPSVHSRLMALRARVAAAPDSAGAHLALARFLQSAHRQGEAAEAFEAALAAPTFRLAPAAERRQAWLDLANAYGADGRWPAAAAAADRMHDHFPGDGAALYNAGAALANAGDTDAARARFEAAVAADDAAMAAQARSALTQLASMPAGTPAASAPSAAPGTAPTLSAGAAAGPLPTGHPPLPSGHPPLPSGGATQRVVDGGAAADPEAVRALLSRQAPLAARPSR